MEKIMLVLIVFSAYSIQAQVVTETLKSIDVSSEKLNEYCGKYSFGDSNQFEISVELNGDVTVIIVPDLQHSDGDVIVTRQYTLAAQYPDQFYVESNPFIKVHFTRSKKSGNIISLLFNANEDESVEVVRAKIK